MATKVKSLKSLLWAGAAAAAIVATPFAMPGSTPVAAAAPAPAHVVFADDPSGGGCDDNGNCGFGSVNTSSDDGPSATGCVPGLGCGGGGRKAGPDGTPGGTGCVPGLGCGGGHG